MITDLEYHTFLERLLRNNNYSEDPEYFEFEEGVEIPENLDADTEIVLNKPRLLRNSLRTKAFTSVESFATISALDVDSNIMILDDDNTISFFNQITYYNFDLKEDYFLISNAVAYLDFQNFLKQLENREIDGNFHFIDSYNRDIRKISLINLSENGRVTINYNRSIPYFDATKDFSIGLENFKNCFEEQSNNLPKFLKSALIASASLIPASDRFKGLFESLNEIVEKANKNFDVYLNNLSVEKILKDYDGLKSKYFETLSGVLQKMTQKIIGFPIALSATIFAVSKIQNEEVFLYLILAAILLTAGYLSLILSLHVKDLNYIKKVFNNDYKVLRENKFFDKHPEELNHFEEIESRVLRRIKMLKRLIETYHIVVNLVNIVLISYIVWIASSGSSITIYLGLALLLILISTNNYIIDKLEKS